MSEYDPATAFHEAGHSFMCRYFGFPGGRAVLFSDGTGLTRTFHPKRGAVCERICVHIAGGEAEHRFIGEYGPDVIDRTRALNLAHAHGLDADDVDELRRKTRAIIDRHWPVVRNIALALKRSPKGRLSASAIDTLFATKMAMMKEKEI